MRPSAAEQGISQSPSSSLSQRTDSRASQRTASSLSRRPSSSLTQRPTSSASNRPTSSASIRPTSRVSQRPGSRQSRPATRQTSRLLPQYHTLVAQVTGLRSQSDDSFKAAVDLVAKNLEFTKGAAGVDMATIDRRIEGHAQKARINSKDDIAEALETSYKRLKAQRATDDPSQTIRMSHLPDHLQLLLALSLPADQFTRAFADNYLQDLRMPPELPPQVTWKDILAEEPFTGQHWEGVYGLPPGSTVENWDTRSAQSSPSLSPLDGSDESCQDDTDSLSSLGSAEPSPLPVPSLPEPSSSRSFDPQAYAHRKEVEDLQARQYWRPEWRTDALLTRPFDLGDASTLGPSVPRIIGRGAASFLDGSEQECFIHECDAVREILMALQGRENLLMFWSSDAASQSFMPSPSAPRLVHVTPTAFASLLSSLASTATVLEHLRRFVSYVFTKSSQAPPHPSQPARRLTRTLEAFSDAVDQEIQMFHSWCAAKEAEICRAHAGIGPPLAVSLLSLENGLRCAFSESFSALLDVLRSVLTQTSRSRETTEVWMLTDMPARVPPAAVTCLLLDTLLHTVQTYSSMGDISTCNTLMRVFVHTAEPSWTMIGCWLKDGMPVRDANERRQNYGVSALDEFFIEDNEMTLIEAEFWADGYTLRGGFELGEEGNDQKATPTFLAQIAGALLASGKAIGLLRAMGVPPSVDGKAWLPNWPSFKTLLASYVACDRSVQCPPSPPSIDVLTRVVCDEVLPHCQATDTLLVNVIVDDCALLSHLSAIEDVFLMRKGDAMSQYSDALFAKMDNHQQWTDFHFLNSAFAGVVEAQKNKWIQTALVRLAYRGPKERSVSRTVRAIDGLMVEYAVPFPLTYIFTARILQVYGTVFVFLLQIRRAKTCLERFLLRGAVANAYRMRMELKAFYAMRSRLSWFINTLLNFLTTYVIHTQVLKFHEDLQSAKSLDSIIQLHDAHIEKIQGRCLLKPNMAALHRAVISILDVCLHFGEFFVAFAGDTTLDISRNSISLRRHRSRRQRRQLRNVIGFSQSIIDSHSSSEDDTDDGGDEAALRVEPSFSMVTSTDEAPSDRLDKMSTELDSLIRFIRRGVETLAGGTGEAAPAFGVLAFALEDWDR